MCEILIFFAISSPRTHDKCKKVLYLIRIKIKTKISIVVQKHIANR